MHDNEHPICVCYNWNVLNQTNTHCFVIKDFTLKSPYLDLRNELAGTLPPDAIRRRLERIQYKTDENKRLALARHREQIDTLVGLIRN
jgi:predicted urease superfamily metal-dependent hydrolase